MNVQTTGRGTGGGLLRRVMLVNVARYVFARRLRVACAGVRAWGLISVLSVWLARV